MMKINRRTFVKGIGASAVTASMVGLVPSVAAQTSAREGNKSLLNKRNGTIKYHTCLRNCADRCLLKFAVQDGRMTYVTGSVIEEKTGTAPCVKAHTYVQYTYTPDRILHPMERVGPKGSGKWKRISWDEAYTKIADRFNKIIKEDGAQAILPYSYSGNYGAIGMYGSADRFFNKLNSRILDRWVCVAGGDLGLKYTLGTSHGTDVEGISESDLYISWGWNEPATNVHFLKYINKNRDRGLKVIVVNPVRTAFASQADLFIQLKPSSDVHFCAGVMKYMVENNLHDIEYLKANTFGWEALFEQLKGTSYDEVVKVTGVSMEQIIKFAKMYTDNKTVMMRQGLGLNRSLNGGRVCRTAAIMHAVGGHYGKLGNGVVYVNGQALHGGNWNKVKAAHLRTDHDAGHVNMTELAKALDAENPTAYGKPCKPVKALVIYNGNPAAVAPNADAIVRNLKREDLFVVGFDFLMHESMDVCDIIVPSSTQFEADDVIGSYCFHYVQLCEKVIEPLGESKDNWSFFQGLGKKMGFTDPEFDVTNEDMIKEYLDSDNPIYKDVTYERLVKEKSIKVDAGVLFADGKFDTPSGKIEIYSERMKNEGFHPVIDFTLPREEMEEREAKLPFHMISPAIPQRANSAFYNVEYIRNFPAYYVIINPRDAADLGVKNGEQVRLHNHRGEAFFAAMVSDQVDTGVVMAIKNNLRRYNPNGSNTCTNTLCTDTLSDIGGGSAYHSTRVAIEKA